MSTIKVDVYTDGSAKNNGTYSSCGGWAFVTLVEGAIVGCEHGAVSGATNQQMELKAVVEACKYIRKIFPGDFMDFHIYSDSAYVINCKKQRWYKKWLQNGWTNSKHEPVKNKEYWEELVPFFEDNHFKFHKVKGHADNPYNNAADNLAQAAASVCKLEETVE